MKKGTNEGYSFDVRNGIDIELSNKQDESFKILESWCLFFHRLMDSNRLAVLSQLSKSVYGAPQTIFPSLRPECNLMVIHNIKLITIFYGGQPSILQMDLC